jgi:hypothetical protein
MTAADRDPIDRFDAALDALRRGDTPRDGVDPLLIAAVVRLRALDREQRPDPSLRDRIWNELVNQAGLVASPSLPHAGLAAPAALNGRSAPRPWRATTSGPTPIPRRGSTHSWLAVAAVFLLSLGIGLLLWQLANQEARRNVLDAAHRPAIETLVDGEVEGSSDAWTPLAVERWSFKPRDATLEIPPLDGPQWIVAETSGFVATISHDEQRLMPGVGVIVPPGARLVLRNVGDADGSALRGVAAAGFALEEYDRAAIRREAALETEAHEALPPGTSRVVLERMTLISGTALLLEPATGQDWLAVSSGKLGLTLTGGGLPLNWQSGHEREVAAGEPLPPLVPGTRATLRNIGEEPLVLLRLRVLPTSGRGAS